MSSLLKLYARPAQLFTHGNGCYLFDSNSKKYLDFTSGIAVNALGHNHPGVVDVISKQSKKLIHLSNLYHGEHAESLASKMVHGLDGRLKDAKVFFCNSGAEANEGAFKFAKKYAKKDNLPNKNGIISFSSGFHGRTFGALSATPNPKYQTPFLPLLPHFQSIKFNDAGALNTINDDTAAVIVEPLQGEGGVFPIDPNFFRQLREKCDQHNVVLICDEIQVI